MKLLAAICLIGLVAVSARCPNQCSGHGTCKSKDESECYKSKTYGGAVGEAYASSQANFVAGNADFVAWTGADCSLRTAKKARAWVECANQGICDRKTGQCKCFDGYEGQA